MDAPPRPGSLAYRRVKQRLNGMWKVMLLAEAQGRLPAGDDCEEFVRAASPLAGLAGQGYESLAEAVAELAAAAARGDVAGFSEAIGRTERVMARCHAVSRKA